MIYIIGSGLSSIAAARALVARGFRPTILDSGVQPDPNSVALKTQLAAVEPEAWNEEDLKRLKRMGPAASTGIPRKLHFGSDFAYQNTDVSTSPSLNRASILRSFARGGFSNVWGAVIQPWPESEFRSWPVEFSKFQRHYDAVHSWIRSGGTEVLPSSQARGLHRDMEIHRRELDQEGVRFRYATLAVRASEKGAEGCRHCGLCLYGCPYDSVFSAAFELKRMIQEGQVNYVPEVIVDRLVSNCAGVRIEARCAKGNCPRIFESHAVFVGAGVLETARIVLNSTGFPGWIVARQSEIFTIPLVHYRRATNISRERLHTLCQIMVEIKDGSICQHPVQLQLYGYNDMYPRLLADRVGSFAGVLKPLIPHVAERLVVAFGYLHSNVSSRLRIRRKDGSHGILEVEGDVSPELPSIGASVVRKLFRVGRYFKAMPIPLQLRFDSPGGGHRSGGCFPMKRTPAALETDEWGRLPSLPGVYVVDSTVLPMIPALPLAFTVMANAHRIASECPLINAA